MNLLDQKVQQSLYICQGLYQIYLINIMKDIDTSDQIDLMNLVNLMDKLDQIDPKNLIFLTNLVDFGRISFLARFLKNLRYFLDSKDPMMKLRSLLIF